MHSFVKYVYGIFCITGFQNVMFNHTITVTQQILKANLLFVVTSNISTEDQLYTEADLEESMSRIETINFHEEKVVNGIKFWCYHAGCTKFVCSDFKNTTFLNCELCIQEDILTYKQKLKQ